MDCDDYWPEYKLTKQIEAFRNPEVVLSYGISCMVNQIGKKIGFSKIPNDYSIANNDPIGSSLKGLFYNRWSFIPNLTVMMRRDVINRIGGFLSVENLYQDYPTWVRMSLEGKFCAIPMCLGYYRKHPSALTFKTKLSIKNKTLYKYSFIIDFIEKHKEKLNELGLFFDTEEIKLRWQRFEKEFDSFVCYENAFLFIKLGLFKEAYESFKTFSTSTPSLKHKAIKTLFLLSNIFQYDFVSPIALTKENLSKLIKF